jgi:hypothetical protein
MKRAHIDKALVFAADINDLPTERLLVEVAPYRDKLFPIGSVSPLSSQLPSLKKVEEWLSEKQIHGLKFYPGYEYFYPADPSLRPYLKLLAKYNRPAIFHSGDTYNRVGAAKLKYAQAIHIDDLAAELPDLKIVIAHLGYPWVIDAAEVCYKNKNVYVDCSGFVYNKFAPTTKAHFRQVLEEFERISNARDRIIFGTDWPIGEQSSYLHTVQSIMGRDNSRLYSENAIALFNLT